MLRCEYIFFVNLNGQMNLGVFVLFKGIWTLLVLYTVFIVFCRSNVSLKDGFQSDARTALCISPNFENDPPHIVYKTFQNDSWDTDQLISKSPLLQGQLFIIKILITPQAYTVYII